MSDGAGGRRVISFRGTGRTGGGVCWGLGDTGEEFPFKPTKFGLIARHSSGAVGPSGRKSGTEKGP